MGGGHRNTTSLHELLDLLEEKTGKRSKIKYKDWRPADQKVFISDISKVCEELDWSPKTSFQSGLSGLIGWVQKNKKIF